LPCLSHPCVPALSRLTFVGQFDCAIPNPNVFAAACKPLCSNARVVRILRSLKSGGDIVTI